MKGDKINLVNVKFHFHNIQTHANTEFEFKQGINLIVSDDNNVGKSAIFNTITMMARMPLTTNGELGCLLRNYTNQGYASVSYSINDIPETVTLRLYRDSTQVRGFIEHSKNGEVTRLNQPPNSFYTALGIKLSKSGDVINIISADSVQLFVDNTTAADEIIADILIDENVERIKQNISRLLSTTTNDLKQLNVALTLHEQTCKSTEYILAVDDFFEEYDNLLDIIDSTSNIDMDYLSELQPPTKSIPNTYFADRDQMIASLNCINILNDAITSIDNLPLQRQIPHQDLRVLTSCAEVMTLLETPTQSLNLLSKKPPNQSSVSNMIATVKLLSILNGVMFSLNKITNSEYTLQHNLKEIDKIHQTLSANYSIVACPVKGEVYYGDECIPVNNRPTPR